MARVFYKVMMSYPDGHVEEIAESFNDLDSAVEYGKSMLAQVRGTERFHLDKGDVFGEKKAKKKPSFEIVKKTGSMSTIVFSSKEDL